jgi:Na+-driven multidrug efflux pump
VLLGAVLNGFFDYLFIFGMGEIITPMGSTGAALGTILAQIIQVVLLGSVFLNRKNKATFNTHDYQFKVKPFYECLKIGAPSSLSHIVEYTAWAVLLQIVARVDVYYLTIQAIGNSVLSLFMCATEGLRDGVVVLASNFIGAKQIVFIKKLLHSFIILHVMLMVVVIFIIFYFFDSIILYFISSNQEMISLNFRQDCWILFAWVEGYIFVYGISRTISGILTAGKDTYFIMVVNVATVWLFVVMPFYFLIYYWGVRPVNAWGVCLLYGITSAILFYRRCRKHNLIN